jgi:hypothetical protein
MKELFERIAAWHEKNLPAELSYEPLPQIGFLIEELGEVNKEFIAGNTDKAVGEICDLIVFSVNALVLLNGAAIEREIGSYSDNSFISVIKQINTAINTIIRSAWFNEDFPSTATYCNLIEVCCDCVASLGYSPEIALEETVRKIESRRGAWDSSIGKWVKEKNQTDVYIPDYSLARLS